MIAVLLTAMACGTIKRKPLTECEDRRRDLMIVYGAREQIYGKVKILCPGDSIKF